MSFPFGEINAIIRIAVSISVILTKRIKEIVVWVFTSFEEPHFSCLPIRKSWPEYWTLAEAGKPWRTVPDTHGTLNPMTGCVIELSVSIYVEQGLANSRTPVGKRERICYHQGAPVLCTRCSARNQQTQLPRVRRDQLYSFSQNTYPLRCLCSSWNHAS